MKKQFTLCLLLATLSLSAQQLPPVNHTNQATVLVNKAVSERFFLGIPTGPTPVFPAYVPDSLKKKAVYMVDGTSVLSRGIYIYNTTTSLWEKDGVNQFPLDANVVHKAGAETIAGNKTYTGSTGFSTVTFSDPALNAKLLKSNGSGIVVGTTVATELGYTPANDAEVVKNTGDQSVSGNLNLADGKTIGWGGTVSTPAQSVGAQNVTTVIGGVGKILNLASGSFAGIGMSTDNFDTNGFAYFGFGGNKLKSTLFDDGFTSGRLASQNALVELVSTTKGFQLPRMSQAQRLAIAPESYNGSMATMLYQNNLDEGIYYLNSANNWLRFLNTNDLTAYAPASQAITNQTNTPEAKSINVSGHIAIGGGTDNSSPLTINPNAGTLPVASTLPTARFVALQDRENKVQIDGRNGIPSLIFAREGANGGAPKKDSIAFQIQLATMRPDSDYSETRTSVIRAKYVEDVTADAQGHDFSVDNVMQGTKVNRRRFFISDKGYAAFGAGSASTLFEVVVPSAGVGLISTTSGSATVTGTNSVFTTSFNPGDAIMIGSETRYVSVVSTNTSLTTTAAWTATNTAAQYSVVSKKVFRVHPNGVAEFPSYTTAGGIAYFKTAGELAQTAALSGLLKGNGTGAPTAAVADVDYMPANKIIDAGQQTLASTISWTGTTAPSGTTNHTYQWTQVGKMVTVRFSLAYSVSGTALTEVLVDFPSDLPAPATVTGIAVTNNAYTGYGGFLTSIANPLVATGRVGIKSTSGVYQIRCIAASANAAYAQLVVTYWTN